jgi:hypothetical protein
MSPGLAAAHNWHAMSTLNKGLDVVEALIDL